MKAISIEQLYATLKSISRSVFQHISKAQETADKAQETANAKMGAVNPTVTGYFAMNPPGNYVAGTKSHSEGGNCRATGGYAHAEGQDTIASGWCSHTEGEFTEAAGTEAHAEGRQTKALGNWSHAEGNNTIAACNYQHVEGAYNIVDEKIASQNGKGKYIHIVGNGTGEIINGDEVVRSNAHTLDWDGNAWYKGDVYVGGTGQDDENASKLIAQKDIGDGLEVVGGKLNTFYRKVELINSFTVTEDVDSLAIDKDADGNPFELKVALMHIQCDMNVAEGEATGSITFSTPTSDYFARVYLLKWKYPGYKVTDTYARPSAARGLCDVSRDFAFIDGIYGDEGGGASENFLFPGERFQYAPNTVIVKAWAKFKVPKNAKVWLYGVRRIGV